MGMSEVVMQPLNGCLQTRCLLVFLYVYVSVNILLNWERYGRVLLGDSGLFSSIYLCELVLFDHLFIIELLFEFARLIL